MTPLHRTLRIFATLALSAAVTLACSLGSALSTSDPTSTAAAEAPATEAPPTATSVPPTETAVPPTPTVTHLVQPGDIVADQYHLTDVNSAGTDSIKRALAGDNYSRNRLERPFLSTTMDYQSDLDIVWAHISADDLWYYFVILLSGPGSDSAESFLAGPTYAIELDLDGDGRGDMLIRAPAPPGDWTTDGVQVWTDSNNDVGGPTPMNADSPGGSLDGYDTLVFDQGVGEDSDAAWIRLPPLEDTGVQFAVKKSVVGDPAFLWGAWADEGVSQPGWLDYNDHFGEAEAGSLNQASGYFPLQAVAAVDNTCRMFFGYSPTGSEPGLCAVTGTVRNCSPHPMKMEPGGKILPPFFESGSTLTDVRIGTYTFYDQSVEGHPAVLTATLSVGGTITITKTGFGDVYPCQ